MFYNDDPLRVEFVDGRHWLLVEDFSYHDVYEGEGWDGEPQTVVNKISVPAGFLTDFASIPRGLWNLLPPTGEYGKAAVIHDFLYTYGKDSRGPVTKLYADQVFKRAMADLGVGVLRRNVMYAAVRIGGRGIWSKPKGSEK
jgi:hypothetical protein